MHRNIVCPAIGALACAFVLGACNKPATAPNQAAPASAATPGKSTTATPATTRNDRQSVRAARRAARMAARMARGMR